MENSTYIIKVDELVDMPVVNTPNNIFLNMGDLYIGNNSSYDFNELSDITWSTTSNGNCDIKYIREDIHKEEQAKLKDINSKLMQELSDVKYKLEVISKNLNEKKV
jgi:hypothetical protein